MSRLDLAGLRRFKDDLLQLVGRAGGIAGLDANGKVPAGQLGLQAETDANVNAMLYDMMLSTDAYYSRAFVGTAVADHALVQEDDVDA